MSMSLNERNPHILEVNVGTIGATTTFPAAFFRKHSRIKEVRFINQSTIAADNTNYLQLSLQDLAANVYASLDTRAAHEGAVTALTAKLCPLTSPDDSDVNHLEKDVPAGTNLKLVATKNGTGVTTLGKLLIEWYPV